VAGDEIGRTQDGNNNAYCQDNRTSWIDWNLTPENEALLAFVQRMMALRAMHPVFHRRHFFQGRPLHGTDIKDIVWLKPDGAEMTDQEWSQDFARCLGVYLEGEALDEVDTRGRPVIDDGFLVLFNAHHEPVPFRLPDLRGDHWRPLIDTVEPDGLAVTGTFVPGDIYPLQGRALVLLLHVRGDT
jgi:isoamylase